jgi:leucyl-tRNA synthetase
MGSMKDIDKKWQQAWDKARIFEVKDLGKNPCYVLEMFPYPSGSLHMGHLRNYSIGDCYARYKRMNKFNVLYPMGYDSFGLPAENAAIKHKSHPAKFTFAAIDNIRKQQKSLGLSYDWTREVITCKPEYYKWNQWIFLQLLKKGLAYKKEAPVNWCNSCDTVLANEQVEEGTCWRCHNGVIQKNLSQWFFKITDYADELLKDTEKLTSWPERVRVMQQNWIGKSEGVEIFFKLDKTNQILPTFTTRPDTIYSVTFLVISPENPLVMELVKGTKYEKETKEVIKKIKKQSDIERTAVNQEKIGCFLGKYAINPVNNTRIPIYIANFVLNYGTGIVMADAHDQRDFEFAKKYNIPLKFVISEDGKSISPKKAKKAYTADGILFDSGEFSGMNNRDALSKIATWLQKKKLGKKTTNYKLRDWLISRQRYWGTPIPIIYCKSCGVVPVSEKDLPVELPSDVTFTSKGNPLTTSKIFKKVKCPKCNKQATRETDTMDTFVDSSWYMFRYCSPQHKHKPFHKKTTEYWGPINQYIGGIEHAVMHLLYARFFTKALRDCGLVSIDEPFRRLLCQGMVLKDGTKMSKSLGNVVDPNEIIDKYGADTARLFILFAALPEKELEWSDQGVEGSYRFLKRVFTLYHDNTYKSATINFRDKHILSHTHRTIELVTNHVEKFEFSLAIGKIMELVSVLTRYKANNQLHEKIYTEALTALAKLLVPFTPHIAEECWGLLGNKSFVSLEAWPKSNKKNINLKAEAAEETIHTTRADIASILKLTGIKPKEIRLFVASEWKYQFIKELRKRLKTTRKTGEIIKSIMQTKLKMHGKSISRLIQKYVKDPSKMPLFDLDQHTEIMALNENRELIEQLFETRVKVIPAEKSSEAKAHHALPGKPSIIVK